MRFRSKNMSFAIFYFVLITVVSCSHDDPLIVKYSKCCDKTLQWKWQNPLPQGNHLNDIAFFDETTGVVVGGYGTILRTTDGGITWNRISSGTIVDLTAIAITGTTTAIAVGDAGTILYTMDGGINWSRRSSGVRHNLYDVEFVGNEVVTAVGLYTVLRSTDGGQSWKVQKSVRSSLFTAVSFADADTGMIVGGSYIALRTTDGGVTWMNHNMPDFYYGRPLKYHDIRFVDSQVGYASAYHGSGRGVFVTKDSGITWTMIIHGDTSLPGLVEISAGNANTVILISAMNIVRSLDGGDHWQWEHPLDKFLYLRAAYFTSATTGVCVGSGGAILRTTDSGSTWSRLTHGSLENLYGVSFSDANNGYAVGSEGIILRTEDGGDHWIDKSIETNRLYFDVYAIDANTAVAVGAPAWGDIIIWRTEDGGITWLDAFEKSGPVRLTAVAFASDSVGIAIGYGNAILRTNDRGQAWEWINEPEANWNHLTDISFGSAITGTIVGDAGTILRTTDGGLTWIQQSSGVDCMLWDVCFTDDDNGWVVGSYRTILRTTDGGVTWIKKAIGTPDDLICVSFDDSNTGIVISRSGIAYLTNDAGMTWQESETGTSNYLEDVSYLDENTITIVGEAGTILRAVP